ncbi:peptide MFS transporter [Salinibacter grassmerensis]|uniref:peptide MFS transporter n=1 Tax=Salinibacter grassmerensis TaxID=3040353 RepID=UPI0021E8FF0C|nr:peptide MFS transporter [Salinibacter grassmerensis]
MAASGPSSDESMQNGGARAPSAGEAAAVADRRDFFGHPRGLATLFFTELWERFSYYGLRALLVLFMTAPAGAAATNPGLGFGTEKATAVYGLYTAFVYLLALPGGWVADNIWGQRRSVFVGGCIIAAGHFSLAMPALGLPDASFFYLGLFLIVVGTGLLKPNISTMVGDLYPEGGARRDAGFSVFYMGINFGAILGPTLCGWLGENYSWHWGFSLAGFGMLVGLISYRLGSPNLGEAGLLDADDEEAVQQKSRNFYLLTALVTALIVAFGFLATSGVISITLTQVAEAVGIGIILVTLLFFAYLTLEWVGVGAMTAFFVVASLVTNQFVDGAALASQIGVGATVLFFVLVSIARLAAPQYDVSLKRRRYLVIYWLFLLSALFWSGFEQAGSSLNLFARDLTARDFGPFALSQTSALMAAIVLIGLPAAYVGYRMFRRDNLWWVGRAGVALLGTLVVGFLGYLAYQIAGGWTMPASMLQNINPTFIVLLAPVFGSFWTWLANRDANPSIPVKFGLGLLGLAAGFFVIAWGASQATAENPVGAHWLVVTYFLHTCGELALSPVGLSSMTKLAPENRVGQMMGVWFVSTALGNLFAGLIAGRLETLDPSGLFTTVALIIGGGGLVALLAAPPVRRLMGDVE